MDKEAFIKLLEETHQKMMDLTKTKGREYAGSSDQLANFKRNAERINLDPLQIWFVYAAKHFDSISTYVGDVAIDETFEYSENIEGRADDLILYLNIFKALIRERRENAREEANQWRENFVQEEAPAPSTPPPEGEVLPAHALHRSPNKIVIQALP